MLKVLAVVVPLGVAGAISPVMLSEQLVMLAGPGGHRAAARRAAGGALTLAVLTGAIVGLGWSVSLPHEPHLDGTLDVLLGGLLAGLALVLRWRRPRGSDRRPPGEGWTRRAPLVFGAVSMAVNLTTLAFVVAAAKEVAASTLGLLGRVLAGVVVVGLASIPGWVPVVVTDAAPGTAGRGLHRLEHFITRYGRPLLVVCLAAAAVFLVTRGAVQLV